MGCHLTKTAAWTYEPATHHLGKQTTQAQFERSRDPDDFDLHEKDLGMPSSTLAFYHWPQLPLDTLAPEPRNKLSAFNGDKVYLQGQPTPRAFLDYSIANNHSNGLGPIAYPEQLGISLPCKWERRSCKLSPCKVSPCKRPLNKSKILNRIEIEKSSEPAEFNQKEFNNLGAAYKLHRNVKAEEKSPDVKKQRDWRGVPSNKQEVLNDLGNDLCRDPESAGQSDSHLFKLQLNVESKEKSHNVKKQHDWRIAPPNKPEEPNDLGNDLGRDLESAGQSGSPLFKLHLNVESKEKNSVVKKQHDWKGPPVNKQEGLNDLARDLETAGQSEGHRKETTVVSESVMRDELEEDEPHHLQQLQQQQPLLSDEDNELSDCEEFSFKVFTNIFSPPAAAYLAAKVLIFVFVMSHL